MTDPMVLQIPDKFRKDPQTVFYFEYLVNVIRDLTRENDEKTITIADHETRLTALEP